MDFSLNPDFSIEFIELSECNAERSEASGKLELDSLSGLPHIVRQNDSTNLIFGEY
jgi:hypothetical protein